MEANHIYQYSLLNALMAGVCETGITAADLLSKACNQGLGTFSSMTGELVLLDDHIYQLLPHGEVRKATGSDQIPFVTAVNFMADQTLKGLALDSKIDIDSILNAFAGERAENVFLAYRITGMFAYLKCRTVGGQQYRGQSLMELGGTQSIEEYQNLEGTVIGFRCPKIWQGFSVAGNHLHFISADRKMGGHVLEIRAERNAEVMMSMAATRNVHIELPASEEFEAVELVTNDAAVKAVEG